MSLVSSCRPIFESARVLLADMGFRQHDVSMRVITWSGQTVGDGTRTAVDTPLLIQGRRPGVRLVSQKDIIASGGLYEDGDYRIGPFTPAYSEPGATYPVGGIDVSVFNPPTSGAAREIYFRLTGPGMPDGAWFAKIEQSVAGSFSLLFVVRKTASGSP
jgi:hypothetical protein